MKNKSPDTGKENFKTVIIFGKNLKIVIKWLKLPELCVSLCWLVSMLYCFVTSLLLYIPKAEVALLKCDVGTWPLWDFQFILANMNSMSSPSLKSFISLAAPKGEKVLGMPLQTELLSLCTFCCQPRLWSDCALSVLAESWHRPWYSSQPFPAWTETAVPVLALGDHWDGYK